MKYKLLFLLSAYKLTLSPAYGGLDPKPFQDTAQDPGIDIVSRRAGDKVTLYARLKNISDVTLSLGLHLKDMTCSKLVGTNTVLIGEGDHPVAWLVGRHPSRRWNWYCDLNYIIGHRPSKLPRDWHYLLPYAGLRRCEVTLGPHGLPSHGPGTGNEEAVDFGLPEGSRILAARGGKVVAVRNDRISGSANFDDDGNHVIIRHEDGTYAQYAHCQHNGVLVRVGEVVSGGQPIALCGHTGEAGGPHLHFCVYYPVDAIKCVTIPLVFKSRSGAPFKPVQGQYY